MDLDLDEALVTVRHSLKREHNKLVLGDPKTQTSRRTLSLPPSLIETLRSHRARQARQRLRAGELWCDLGLVFTTEIGTPVDPSNYRRELNRLCGQVGIGHWSPNELRHSAASLLASRGVPVEHIANQLGHATTRMTMAVYIHQLNKSVDAAVAPMEQMFGGA